MRLWSGTGHATRPSHGQTIAGIGCSPAERKPHPVKADHCHEARQQTGGAESIRDTTHNPDTPFPPNPQRHTLNARKARDSSTRSHGAYSASRRFIHHPHPSPSLVPRRSLPFLSASHEVAPGSQPTEGRRDGSPLYSPGHEERHIPGQASGAHTGEHRTVRQTGESARHEHNHDGRLRLPGNLEISNYEETRSIDHEIVLIID